MQYMSICIYLCVLNFSDGCNHIYACMAWHAMAVIAPLIISLWSIDRSALNHLEQQFGPFERTVWPLVCSIMSSASTTLYLIDWCPSLIGWIILLPHMLDSAAVQVGVPRSARRWYDGFCTAESRASTPANRPVKKFRFSTFQRETEWILPSKFGQKIVLWADPDEAKPTVSDVFSTKHVRWNDNDSWFQMLRYKLQQLLLIRWKGPKHSEPACCIQQRLSGKIEGIIATSLYKYLPNSHEQKEIVWGLNTIPDRLGAK